ncbi:MAG: sarcosine oxidase subunit delta [Pseudomonadota bacterium]
MRITCPICGSRDRREFYYQGAALALDRPDPDAGAAAWDDYLHLRDNVAGEIEELWSHDAGCGAWLKVVRNVATHEVRDVTLVREGRK